MNAERRPWERVPRCHAETCRLHPPPWLITIAGGTSGGGAVKFRAHDPVSAPPTWLMEGGSGPVPVARLTLPGYMLCFPLSLCTFFFWNPLTRKPLCHSHPWNQLGQKGGGGGLFFTPLVFFSTGKQKPLDQWNVGINISYLKQSSHFKRYLFFLPKALLCTCRVINPEFATLVALCTPAPLRIQAGRGILNIWMRLTLTPPCQPLAYHDIIPHNPETCACVCVCLHECVCVCMFHNHSVPLQWNAVRINSHVPNNAADSKAQDLHRASIAQVRTKGTPVMFFSPAFPSSPCACSFRPSPSEKQKSSSQSTAARGNLMNAFDMIALFSAKLRWKWAPDDKCEVIKGPTHRRGATAINNDGNLNTGYGGQRTAQGLLCYCWAKQIRTLGHRLTHICCLKCLPDN